LVNKLYDPEDIASFSRVIFLLKLPLCVAVSEKKQASSQAKSDEAIILSVVKEQITSLEESVLMRLKELMEVS
jgi:hypothetical protein